MKGFGIWEWSLITGRGGYNKGGGPVKFYPYEKGGGHVLYKIVIKKQEKLFYFLLN